jgi:2-amino-4-hydroxy-6-hydroxymethyldihydropteridine diphosphokinase
MTSPFAVALGSNLGDRLSNLAAGAAMLFSDRRTSLPRLSGVYESPPACGAAGGPFLNAVLAGLWTGCPHSLLELCREAERTAGSPVVKNGAARTLDMDLLYVGAGILRDDDLILPHPRAAGREFVLRPLADVTGDRPIPALGATAAELLAALPRRGDIVRVVAPPEPGVVWDIA